MPAEWGARTGGDPDEYHWLHPNPLLQLGDQIIVGFNGWCDFRKTTTVDACESNWGSRDGRVNPWFELSDGSARSGGACIYGHSATVAGNQFQSAFHETEHSWIVIANTKQLAALDRRFDLATRRSRY